MRSEPIQPSSVERQPRVVCARGVENPEFAGAAIFAEVVDRFQSMVKPESPQWAASTISLKNVWPSAVLAACTNARPRFQVGEGLEFTRTEKLDVPALTQEFASPASS